MNPKLLLAGAMTHPLVGRALATVYRNNIPSGGLKFDTSGPAVDDRSKASLFWGFYEKAERGYISTLLRRDLDVVELGASLGVVTSTVASIIGPQQRIVTVEANPRMIPSLRTNVERHAKGRSITIVHGAVSYESDSEMVSIDIGDRSIAGRVSDMASAHTVDVPRLTLVGLLAEHEIGDFILVSDIEGAEIGLFLEDEAALERCRQIVIELHDGSYRGRSYSVREARGLVASMPGFSVVAEHGGVMVLNKR